MQVIGDRIAELDLLPEIGAAGPLDIGRVAAELTDEIGDGDDVLLGQEAAHRLVGDGDLAGLLGGAL